MSEPNNLKTSRFVAAEILTKWQTSHRYACDILNELAYKTDHRQHLTDLVFGSVRNQSAIHRVVEKLSKNKIKNIQPQLLSIITIALFELLYSPDTKQYAIVNEAVENAKLLFGKKPANFVNAILRQITRGIKNRNNPLIDNFTKSNFLPTDIDCGCLFNNNIFPDPEKHSAAYLSCVFSLPNHLVKDWLKNYGRKNTLSLCLASNRKPSIYIRPNLLRTSFAKLSQLLTESDIAFSAIEDLIMLKSPGNITDISGFHEGLFTVQDLAAFKVTKLIDPKSSWKILDLCSAPGGKTTHLAEATSDRAKIFATDINQKRLELVSDNVRRLKLKSIEIIDYSDIAKTSKSVGLFDCVLADVPCSNTGVLAKRPEARWRLTSESIKDLVRLQKQILEQAAELVTSGGILCYSTCSICQEENAHQIDNFLKSHKNFQLVKHHLILPHINLEPDVLGINHDGGYAAILLKNQ